MPYKELREGYSLVRRDEVTTGERSFIEVPAGGQPDLPELGDPFSVTEPLCLLISIKEVKYAVDHVVGTDLLKYVCEYSSETSTNLYPQFLNSYSGGGRFESIKDPTSWYWCKAAGDTSVAGSPNDQSIYLISGQGSFSKNVIIPSVANPDSYPGKMDFEDFITAGWSGTDRGVLKSLGKINSSTYDYFRTGQLLLSGWSAKPMNDKDGFKIWLVSLNFSYLMITVNGLDLAEHSWQYILNDKASETDYKYQLPCKSKTPTDISTNPNGVYMYDYIDFNTSLSTTI